ncbi:transcriptional regulator [Pseudonocardia sp. Ae707_Ps2]
MTEVSDSNQEPAFDEAGRPRPTGGHDAVHHVCPLNEVLDRVSGKWAIGVLTLIGAEEVARFTELERGIPGISRRMLTLTLRNLERDGLLTRTVYATVPPRTEYRLTEAARELARTLSLLTDWAKRHQTHVQVSRLDYDGAH